MSSPNKVPLYAVFSAGGAFLGLAGASTPIPDDCFRRLYDYVPYVTLRRRKLPRNEFMPRRRA